MHREPVRLTSFKTDHGQERIVPLGKSIRIYLADGNVTGIRHGEIVNWTGQAIACPRTRLQDLRGWPEAKRPGVYFLLGVDEETGQEAVYIGEAEIVLDRLYQQIAEKDFWSELIAFTSKDDNLTKGHVRYLESRLVSLAHGAARYIVKNGNAPQLPALPRSDRDAMEEYLEATRSLLGVFGHKVLEPLVAPSRVTSPPPFLASDTPAAPIPAEPLTAQVDHSQQVNFELRTAGLVAQATRTDEGMVVLQGSDVALATQPSLSNGYRAIREKLLQTGALVPEGSRLKLVRDHLFTSPSQAAAIVVGYAINGRDAWRLPQSGMTYGAYEDQLAQALVNSPPSLL